MTNFEIATARTKSYTGTAIMVFILYVFFFLPGFFLNYIYVQEANRMQRIAGCPLPGVAALNVMLVVGSASILLMTCLTMVISGYVLYIFFR